MDAKRESVAVRHLIVGSVGLAGVIGLLWFANFLSPPAVSASISASSFGCSQSALEGCDAIASGGLGADTPVIEHPGYPVGGQVFPRCLLLGVPCKLGSGYTIGEPGGVDIGPMGIPTLGSGSQVSGSQDDVGPCGPVLRCW